MVREVKNTDLLSIARTVLRDEVLNVIPEHKKYEALMVANAMAIAAMKTHEVLKWPRLALYSSLRSFFFGHASMSRVSTCSGTESSRILGVS